MRSDASHFRWRVGLGSLVIAIGSAPIAYLFVLLVGIRSPWFVPAVLLVIVCIIVVIQLFVRVVPDTVAAWVLSFLMPGDAAGPRALAFSHAQAMAVRGDTEDAAREFQRLLAAAPDDVALHRAAAEFFTKVDASKAASVFQRLRQLPRATSEDEHYATHRLIDLYGGPLRNNGRLRMELRRLIERFPGTREAEGAEVALRRLREDADG